MSCHFFDGYRHHGSGSSPRKGKAAGWVRPADWAFDNVETGGVGEEGGVVVGWVTLCLWDFLDDRWHSRTPPPALALSVGLGGGWRECVVHSH